MIERLEVGPGPGTVIRYGSVAAWAGPAASASLVSFLSESARNLAPSAVGGDQLADHLEGVLRRRDPEPDVAFIAMGPGEEGWTALLHGPVQVWDGTGWTGSDPESGWLRTRLWPRPTLSVSVTGAPLRPPSPDSMLDLEAGVVPGGGFVLVPVVPAAAIGTGAAVEAGRGASTAEVEETTVLALADAGPPTMVLPLGEVAGGEPEDAAVEPEPVDAEPAGADPAGAEPAGAEPAGGEPAGAEPAGAEPAGAEPAGAAPVDPATASELEPSAPAAALPSGDRMAELPVEAESAAPSPVAGESSHAEAEPEPTETEPAEPEPTEGPEPAETEPAEGPEPAETEPAEAPASFRPGSPAPAGLVDLRSAAARARVVPYPPLPPAGDPPRPVAGAPVVAGIPCPRGHLNRPGMPSCARCGQPVTDGQDQVSGTRPALGCLVTDEGAVYRLDSGYLVGSDPTRDPTVRGRLARALALPGDDVAASHAEIRLHDWDVVVTDRASEGGTHVFEPGNPSWERIRPYEPRVLVPGTHLAFGQRVVTFLTPWNR